jgi:hypothetical protein
VAQNETKVFWDIIDILLGNIVELWALFTGFTQAGGRDTYEYWNDD